MCLAALMPAHTRPVLVTDAGFRSPWFRAVSAQGWDWVGRLRGTIRVKPVAVADRDDHRAPCRALHPRADQVPRLLPAMHINRSHPLRCCLAVCRKPAKGRKHLTRRVGREALARPWPMEPVWRWLQRLRELPEHVLDQMVAPFRP